MPPPKAAPTERAAPVDLLPAPAPVFGNIPWTYGDNRITAMARDPYCIFAYWEFTDDALAAARARIGDPHAAIALRVYDTTHVAFNGLNPHSFFDVDVDRGQIQHYLHVDRPGATFHLDIGVRGWGGYAPIARSGAVDMPRNSVSPDTHTQHSTILRSSPGYSYRHRYRPGPVPPPPPWIPTESASVPAELEGVFQELVGEGWTRTEWIETEMDGRAVRWIRWSGPFTPERFPDLPGAFRTVEVLFQGERRTVRAEQGEQTVTGPWRVVVEAVGPGGERRLLERWFLHRRWTTEQGSVRVDTPAILTRILGGTRSTKIQSGSESHMLLETWGSEQMLHGASEWMWAGGSEIVGASESLFSGGSEGSRP